MKTRHAAALALMGWYLIVPPLHKNGIWTRWWFGLGQFADWNIVNTFDSAKECEDYRNQMIAPAQNGSKHPAPGSEYPPADAQGLPDGTVCSPSANKVYRQNPTAICIATDDPRLAK